jgi:putative ABC transport system permease protein
MGRLLRDLRYACRSLRKTPVFTIVAILTLALGIGANAGIFTLVNAVLLRPLPFPEQHRLMFVWEETTMFGQHDSVVSLANYADWRAQNHSFQQMGALETRTFRINGAGDPLQVIGSTITSSVFGTLGVRPAMGRLFRGNEDQAGAAPVVILSDGLHKRLFGGDPSVIGRSILLNDAKHEIVGVMPAGFRFPSNDDDLWTPIGDTYGPREWSNRGRHNFIVVARLAPDVTLERANQDIRAIAARLEQQYPLNNRNVGAFVAPMRDHFVGDTRSMLWILLGAVGFVLLIACANIANLLLARAANRKREVAIRIAIGAGRGGIMRQLMTENVALALAGGACGLLVAAFGVQFLEKMVPTGISGLSALRVDGRVLAFTLGISILTAVMFGMTPALQSLKLDLHKVLKQGGERGATRGRGLQRALVMAEVALAFVLAIGAGLLIQTFAKVRAIDPGFRTQNLLTLRMADGKSQKAAYQAAFYEEVLRRVTAIPGVISAGFSNGVPVAFKGWVNGFAVEGPTILRADRFSNSNYRVVTADYLRTLGVPLREGRMLEARDRMDALPVAVVNEAFQRKFWGNDSAVGRRFRFGDTLPWITIVGVIGDIRQSGLEAASRPELYLPALQQPLLTNWLAVRTAGDPARATAAVRQAIRAADPDMAIANVSTMEQILDRETFQRRVQMILLATFAGLALLLASLGIYGVLAYLVSGRTQEIGLRMALGAAPGDVLRAVVGQGLGLSAAGIVAGILAALGVTRVLSKVLFGVSPTDPLTFAAVAGLLLTVAAVASYVPARRAMRVDPVRALREE